MIRHKLLNKNFKSVMTVVGEAIQTKVLRSNSLAPFCFVAFVADRLV